MKGAGRAERHRFAELPSCPVARLRNAWSREMSPSSPAQTCLSRQPHPPHRVEIKPRRHFFNQFQLISINNSNSLQSIPINSNSFQFISINFYPFQFISINSNLFQSISINSQFISINSNSLQLIPIGAICLNGPGSGLGADRCGFGRIGSK